MEHRHRRHPVAILLADEGIPHYAAREEKPCNCWTTLNQRKKGSFFVPKNELETANLLVSSCQWCRYRTTQVVVWQISESPGAERDKANWLITTNQSKSRGNWWRIYSQENKVRQVSWCRRNWTRQGVVVQPPDQSYKRTIDRQAPNLAWQQRNNYNYVYVHIIW